jgi:hypothetical protein
VRASEARAGVAAWGPGGSRANGEETAACACACAGSGFAASSSAWWRPVVSCHTWILDLRSVGPARLHIINAVLE